MKKLSFSLLMCMLFLCIFNLNKEEINAEESDLFEIIYNQDSDFRAVWVSHLVSDLAVFTNETQFKTEVNKVLDNMEKFNFNVLIFHIRIYNDALYPSKYNNLSTYYKIGNGYDALPWIIDECHKRGIEFHAWMNPYRVAATGTKPLKDIAATFPAQNLASEVEYLLQGSSVTILNPGIPDVQSFLVRTVMEVVENYNVDAIHFDDYFYIEGIDDSKTYEQYGLGQGNNQFRRDSVSALIEKLAISIGNHNKKYGKSVQLGISPTPVWQQGDGKVTYDAEGKAITNGSDTPAAAYHNADSGYWFCDTVKWINEEWIDYIIPQCYQGLSAGGTLFKKAIEWWDKVVARRKTKLYIGIGLYRATSNPDWANQDEFLKELEYMATLDNVEGFSIFSYRHTINSNAGYKKNMESIKDFIDDKVLAPLHDKSGLDKPEAIENAFIERNGNQNKITFTHDPNIRYVILVKKVGDNYSLVDIGRPEYFLDTEEQEATYYIANVGNDNQIGVYKELTNKTSYIVFSFHDINGDVFLRKGYPNASELVMPEAPSIYGMQFKEWEKIDDNTYKAIYSELKFKVTYKIGTKIYKVIEVSYGEDAPNIDVEGYTFNGWRNLPTNITSDVEVKGTGTPLEYKIYYYDGETLLFTDTCNFQASKTLTRKTTKTDQNFLGWLYEDELVTVIEEMPANDIYLYASFENVSYKITYNLDGGKASNLVETFTKNDSVTLVTPTKEGYEFLGWYEGDKLVETIENRDYVLTAHWKEIEVEPEVSNCLNLTIIFEVLALLGVAFVFRRKLL